MSFKILKTVADLMSTKHGSMPVSVLLIQIIVQNISRLAFLLLLKVCKSCAIGLPNTTVLMFAWNLPVSIGFLFLISWRRITFGLLFPTPNIPSLKKATRRIVRMPSGFVIYICAEWLNLLLFHLLTSVN